jgi:hypothetical protein
VFYCQCVIAQLPSVKVLVDKDNILIGQQIHYRVESSMADNTFRLNWFSIPDSFGTFVIVSKDKIDTSISNGNITFSQQLILTNFDSGRQVIPALGIIASDLNSDSSFTIFTDTIPINVSYSPLDSIEPFHDIKPIIEVKNSWPWWAWALIGLGVILLAAIIILITKRLRKKKDTYSIFESKLSPYDEAMKSLTDLEKEDLVNKFKIKEFHTALTDIFKRYLSRVTDSYKLHLTVDEILMELKEYNLLQEEISHFANCLRMGNAVKFAQYVPPAYENSNCFSEVKNVITLINNQVNKKTESDI